MHPDAMYTLATRHQSEFRDEAARERLVRGAKGSSSSRQRAPMTPARKLVAAAAAAILALSLAGAVLANQGGAAAPAPDTGNEPGCVIVRPGRLAAC